jgi:hypothetical protein
MKRAIGTVEREWTHHTRVNKAPQPDQKEQWTMLSHSGDTRVTLKRRPYIHPNSSSKDTLLPFMTILRAGSNPEALVRFQFPPSRIINSLLIDYS